MRGVTRPISTSPAISLTYFTLNPDQPKPQSCDSTYLHTSYRSTPFSQLADRAHTTTSESTMRETTAKACYVAQHKLTNCPSRSARPTDLDNYSIQHQSHPPSEIANKNGQPRLLQSGTTAIPPATAASVRVSSNDQLLRNRASSRCQITQRVY